MEREIKNCDESMIAVIHDLNQYSNTGHSGSCDLILSPESKN